MQIVPDLPLAEVRRPSTCSPLSLQPIIQIATLEMLDVGTVYTHHTQIEITSTVAQARTPPPPGKQA